MPERAPLFRRAARGQPTKSDERLGIVAGYWHRGWIRSSPQFGVGIVPWMLGITAHRPPTG